MPYLTYEEYKGFGFSEITETEFDRLIKKAGDEIDGITHDFYQFIELESDVKYRKTKFKKAVAAQVEFFHEAGTTTSYGLSEPTNVTIGRTSMGSRSGSSDDNSKKNIVSDDAIRYLEPTGLLYRGL